MRQANLINGEWVQADSGQTVDVNNPATGLKIGTVPKSGRVETRRAIEAADAAFKTWRKTTALERSKLLRKLHDAMMDNQDVLAELLTIEQGKSLFESKGEIGSAASYILWFAEEGRRTYGDVVPSPWADRRILVTKEPVGVIAAITPWNFPIAIPAWKIAPALAYGNTIVFKPAELVPESAWTIVDILHRAGLPKGVLNLVMGKGSVVGQAMLDSPDLNAITFTGSVGTGKRVAAASVEHMRKFQLEMGGKNPLVVLDDADLAVAVDCAINGAYFSTGQRCTASSRLVVTDGIHDRFVDAMKDRLGKLAVGDALDAKTQIGPVVDQSQLKQDEDYIAIGRQEGADLAFGGERLDRETRGFYLQPALFTQATNAMRISREEIFGPVANVIRVKNYDEALAVANDTPFGLTSGICTSSLKHATHFKRNSEAGMVMVNLPTAGVDFHVPFGGRKGSSYGPREQGRYAAEFYTAVKTAYTFGG
ncbi:MAG: aldehyde dehydrogenase family protein [Mesorhizobium sp.]|nr:MAG: aldehyde dehydrogenase family protein [Mesorhizobium sp.]